MPWNAALVQGYIIFKRNKGTMIGVKIEGRLGNQLFQYAFATSLAEKLNTGFFLHEVNRFYAHQYFEMNYSPWKNKLRSLSFLLRHIFNRPVITEDLSEDPLQKKERFLNDTTIYNGYFQSLVFFEENIGRLRDELKIKTLLRVNVKKDICKTRKPLLVIHVRLTDYKDYAGRDASLPLSYYTGSFKLLSDFNAYDPWVVSDNIEEAKVLFKDYTFNYSHNNLIVDFQMLQQADAVILANSSFSWWGGILNTHGKVFAPKWWLGSSSGEYPKGVVDHTGWELVSY
jgi:hypothetical protein